MIKNRIYQLFNNIFCSFITLYNTIEPYKDKKHTTSKLEIALIQN